MDQTPKGVEGLCRSRGVSEIRRDEEVENQRPATRHLLQRFLYLPYIEFRNYNPLVWITTCAGTVWSSSFLKGTLDFFDLCELKLVMGEIRVPCLNSVDYCKKFFLINRQVLMTRTQGSTDVANRVVFLHKNRAYSCFRCVCFNDKLFREVGQSKNWG